jgi:hypothetical protein
MIEARLLNAMWVYCRGNALYAGGMLIVDVAEQYVFPRRILVSNTFFLDARSRSFTAAGECLFVRVEGRQS